MDSSRQEWEPMHEHVSLAQPLELNRWRIEHVRNFIYKPDASPVYRWSTYDIDTMKITGAYFYVLPLGQFGKTHGKLFAHTCLGFSFEDGTNLLYSIEARQKIGEEYRPDTQTENVRMFATLDYFLGFRHMVRKRGFFRYPITLPQDTLVCLLRACLEDAHRAYERPDRYHPIKNHCTTALIAVMNRVLEHTIPWHPYWHLTRFTHHLLAKRAIIDMSKKEIL